MYSLTEFELGCQHLQNRNLSEHMYSGAFIDPVIGGAVRSTNLLEYMWYVNIYLAFLLLLLLLLLLVLR